MSRKLDAALAEALGWELLERLTEHCQAYANRKTGEEMLLPHYSTDGRAMLELDKEMRGRGFYPVSYTHLDVYKRQVSM